MGKSNTELLKIAQKHLGEGGARFRKFCGLPAGAAWCNAFVDYVANEGGDASLYFAGKKETYCPHSMKWCSANLAQVPLYWAMPCDIIYFDWEKNGVPNHIGLVRAKSTTADIFTIEGNTDKKDKNGKTVAHGVVAERNRTAKYIQAVYRPHFVPSGCKKAKLKLDGNFTYNSIYNLQIALGVKPSGILTKETVKYLQRKAGANPDGVFGPATARKVQKMVGAKTDGDFGKNSTIALQKWINNINYPPTNKKPSETKIEAQKGKAYGGPYPTPNNNAKIVNGLAWRYCYPYGTPEKTYKYHGGKPKPEYKKGLAEGYPNKDKWPNKKQKAGACCDVFVGAVLAHVGVKVPKDLAKQLVEMPKIEKLKKNGHYLAKQFKAGDVVQRGRKDKSGHTWIVCELVNGKRFIANAHYKKLKGTYAVMDAKPANIVKSKWKYYQCYTVTGAKRTYYTIGDYGLDVLYIQNFLKWYGYKISADGNFGENTANAVKKFQKANGLTESGHVGAKTISKMKAARK